jgi:hypothetical protein
MERHYRSTVMIPEQINATGSLQSITGYQDIPLGERRDRKLMLPGTATVSFRRADLRS